MITKSLTKRESEDIFFKIPINCKNEMTNHSSLVFLRVPALLMQQETLKKKILQGSGKLVFSLLDLLTQYLYWSIMKTSTWKFQEFRQVVTKENN